MVEAFLPAELAEVTDELRPGDELLTANELGSLSLFDSLKKAPRFERLPGFTVLRRCTAGRVLCSQGDAGATAFYILTTEDVLKLRKQQQETLHALLQAASDPDDSQQAAVQPDHRKTKQRRDQYSQDIETFTARAALIHDSDEREAESFRHVATVHLATRLEAQRRKRGWFQRMLQPLRNDKSNGKAHRPDHIPIDGPVDIDAKTLSAPLQEGELFGEMSCMNRTPRSATVVASQDCFMLEMLRNVLDMLHKDPVYKQRMDEMYRQRVLEGQIRRLPIFADLDDDDFDRLRDTVQLKEFESGAVIFEEHEPSDCFYVIRSGLVKVVQNAWCSLRKAELDTTNWIALPGELAAASSDQPGLRREVWDCLPPELQGTIQSANTIDDLTTADRQLLLNALNDFIRQGQLHTKLGKTKQDVLDAVDDLQLTADAVEWPDNPKNWSELEARTFHRLVLEAIFPSGIPKRLAIAGPRRTLAYLGRGDYMGEIGLLLDQPRTATCVAYDHPDSGHHQRIPDSRTGAVPSRVELVRFGRQEFQELLDSSDALRLKVEQVVRERKQRSDAVLEPASTRSRTASATQSPDFEQLGLIQGQLLMLIDLDRCTRCGACVDACVSSHDDGYTRLYLDGPRFENYLVPVTCRKCLDPVCMIGCPVGAIHRGSGGEISISDWCIGCSLCADQCPYGSIQMNGLESPVELTAEQQKLLDPQATVKLVSEQAVVCDLCSSLPSRDPSCVYACPHDAALRVNAAEFFFETEDLQPPASAMSVPVVSGGGTS